MTSLPSGWVVRRAAHLLRSLGPVAATLVLLGVGAAAVSAQVVTVQSGREQAPLPGANVQWIPEGAVRPAGSVATSDQGRARLPESWTGAGQLEIRALGYRTVTLTKEALAASGWTVALTVDPLRLDDVVVTVAGRAQRASEVAVPVERITARDIEAAGVPSAADLLEDISGLQSTGGVPTGQNIMIRGIGDQRVLVLIDGQPVAGALVEDRDLSRLSLAAVDRVEVVKGPLSSLYGSDALGGVINIITSEPPADFRMDAGMMQGGDGRREIDLTLAGGGPVRYRVTGALREQLRVPGLPDDLDASSRVWDLRSTARWEQESGLRIRSDFNLLRERQRWPVGGGFNGFNDNVSLTGWIEGAMPVAAGALSLRVVGQDYSHLFRSSRTDAPIAGSGEEDQQEEQLWRSILMWSAAVGDHGIDLGVDGSLREIRSPDKVLQDQASDRQLEFFAQDAWRIGGGTTTVSAGVRATFNDQWGNAVSPTFGVTSLVGSTVQLRASAGRGFRAPSFKELAWDFANLGGGYTVQGFAGLSAESSWNFSTGVEWAPNNQTRLSAEVFNNTIEGLIELVSVGNTPGGLLIFSPQNLERATTRGGEFGIDWTAGRWRVGADYAWLDTEAGDTELPLDRRATHTGQLRLGGDFGVMYGLGVDLSTAYTGEAPLIGAAAEGGLEQIGVQGAFVAVDARTALEMLPGIQVELGVENLLNQQPEGWLAPVVMRRFRVGVRARDLF